MRDYIYIPLGGNRKGGFRTYNNLMATFVLGGLWHGAAWTFVFWGVLHGLALMVQVFWSKLGFKLWTWVAWLITFNFVNITWVFFRAKEWDDAVKVLGPMFSLDNIILPNILENRLSFLTDFGIYFGGFVENIRGDFYTPIWIFSGFVLILFFKNSMEYMKQSDVKFKYIFTVIAIWFSLYKIISGAYSEFIYFTF
jgi:alginate O-acetyltransferase complex protein AlgI